LNPREHLLAGWTRWLVHTLIVRVLTDGLAMFTNSLWALSVVDAIAIPATTSLLSLDRLVTNLSASLIL
jgi:hypothetical protein